MKKPLEAILHIGFWLCYFMLIFIVVMVFFVSPYHVSNQETRIVNALKSIVIFAFIPSAISYFLFYFFLFPKYIQHKKYFKASILGFIISLLAAIFAYLLIRYLIETGQLIDMDRGGINGRSTALKAILVMTFIGLICGIVSLIIKGFVTWVDEIKLKEQLKEKNHEMELALIKSQLDPHLLFNSINNIDALILKNPLKASNYLNQLSDIMRFTLYETKIEKILLSKEIEYIEKYIALQKIRTANENFVNFSVEGEIGQKIIAPMVFIPFIENAFKHSNNKKLENAIFVKITVKDNSIEMICNNKFDVKMSTKEPNSGLGNELIQNRLNLIYSGKHTLVVDKNIDSYSVKLIINF